MQTATGRLRYNPELEGMPVEGNWLILECDADWYRMYKADAEHRVPGSWRMTVDADRIFTDAYDGRPQSPIVRTYAKGGVLVAEREITDRRLPTVYVDYRPHLALLRPRVDPPAWGPHISIVRGEDLPRHADVWGRQVQLGTRYQALRRLRISARQLREKADAFAATLPSVHVPKERARMNAELGRMQHTLRTHMDRIREAERMVARLRASQTHADLGEDAEIEFEFDPQLRLGSTHWYLNVRVPTVPVIRRFYGLSDFPRIPLHLTVAVTEG